MARSTAATAAFAATFAAAVSLAIADRNIDNAEDRRLRGTGQMAASELDESAGSPMLEARVRHEQEELAPASIRVAVFENGRFVGGDRQLPFLAETECRTIAHGGEDVRACAATNKSLVVIAATTRGSVKTGALALGVALSALIAAIAAAILGRRTAYWALRPLERLTTEVDDAFAGKRLSQMPALLGETAVSPDRDADCAEIATLRRALSSLISRLAVSLDRAQRFSANAAHELRTPLTTIAAELELLAEESGEAATHEAVGRLRARTTSLSELVDNLLALSSARESLRVGATPVAMEDVATLVVDRLTAAERARVDLDITAQGMVLGDESLLAAMTKNLVDNALKFSASGPILVSVRESEDTVVLEVADTGPGIPLELRARIFEPFVRSPESRAQGTPGHGIGLALVAHIAEAHRGSAALDESASGTQIRVVLPQWRSA